MRFIRMHQAFVAIILFVFSWTAAAQVNTADVAGLVSDQTGAAVAGAAVSITNVSTGVERKATSDHSGRFVIASMVPGTYSMEIVKAGFAPAEIDHIVLRAGEVRDLKITLKVGATHEQVEVHGSGLINTDNAERNTTLDSRQVNLLPMASRDWTGLVTQGNGLEMNNSRGTLIMDNLPGGGTSITVDGVPAEGQVGLPSFSHYQNYNLIKQVGQGAIEEISITRGITPANVGATMTGNVNVITKSGTNHLHGSVSWLDNNTVFNASDPFSGKVQPVIQNQYAASLGGPIVRKKLFYFGDYEGFHITHSGYSQLTVPTPGFVAQAEAAVPAYTDWFNLQPVATGSYAPGTISALYGVSEPSNSHDNYGDLRVDYYPVSSWRIIMRYNRARPYSAGPDKDLIKYPKVYQGYTEAGSAQVLYTHGNTLYAGRFGINYNDTFRNEGPVSTYTNSIRKFHGIDTGSFEQLFEGGRDLVYEGNVTTQVGHQVLKFGGSYKHSLGQRQDESAPELKYANLSDLLNNIPDSVKVTDGVSLFSLTDYAIGAFVQDDWKVNGRLTMNAGMRWDYFSPAGEGFDRFFDRGGPNGTGAYLPPGTSWNRQWTHFSPRIGLAFQPTGSGKTVIHAGVGIFYSPHPLYQAPIGAVRDAKDEPNHSTFDRNDVLQYPSLLGFPVITKSTIPLNSAIDSSMAIAQNSPDPYSGKWLFGVQQQLSRNWAIDLEYVGNIAHNLTIQWQVNRPDRITGVRPHAGLGTFDYFNSNGASNYNSLQAKLTHQFSHGVGWNLYYTWSHSLAHSDEAGLISPTEPQVTFNSDGTFDLAAAYGPSESDIRNRLVGNLVYQPLFSRMLGSGCNPVLCDGWELGTIIQAQSGNPFNVTQSSGIAGSRPDLAAPVRILPNYRATRQYLSPSDFREVALSPVSGLPIAPGTEPRDGVYGPGFFNVDLTLARSIRLPESLSFRLEAEMVNAFNHVNYSAPDSEITKSSFGQITSTASGPRVIQFTGRLNF